MKRITFAVPCYNSASYMRKCVDSLLKAGDKAQILIVDDGSNKDNTLDIALEYKDKYPTIVSVISKENGGHGDAVNTAIKNAEGTYFFVVDSDDWVDESSLEKLMEKLEHLHSNDHLPDAIVVNYVYEHVNKKKQKVIHYRKELPKGRNFSFSETKSFATGKFLSMHSMVYKTQLLRSCNLVLPKHTFYVDNLFVYTPLPYVKTFYYLDVDLYRYFIGREDQSVNESVIISRIDQHDRVTRMVFRAHDLNKIKFTDKKLHKYMYKFIQVMLIIPTIYYIIINTPESIEKKRQLWEDLKSCDKESYKKCKRQITVLASTSNRAINALCRFLYKIVRKIFKFN